MAEKVTAKPAADVVEPKIVAAVGTASRSGPTGAMIERAMADAGLKAMEEGVTDPRVILERKLAARQKLKDDMRVADNTEAKAKAVSDVKP